MDRNIITYMRNNGDQVLPFFLILPFLISPRPDKRVFLVLPKADLGFTDHLIQELGNTNPRRIGVDKSYLASITGYK